MITMNGAMNETGWRTPSREELDIEKLMPREKQIRNAITLEDVREAVGIVLDAAPSPDYWHQLDVLSMLVRRFLSTEEYDADLRNRVAGIYDDIGWALAGEGRGSRTHHSLVIPEGEAREVVRWLLEDTHEMSDVSDVLERHGVLDVSNKEAKELVKGLQAIGRHEEYKSFSEVAIQTGEMVEKALSDRTHRRRLDLIDGALRDLMAVCAGEGGTSRTLVCEPGCSHLGSHTVAYVAPPNPERA